MLEFAGVGDQFKTLFWVTLSLLAHNICGNIWHLAEPCALKVMTNSKWHVQHYGDREKSKKSRKNRNFQIKGALLDIFKSDCI